jgi:hypothetical protein
MERTPEESLIGSFLFVTYTIVCCVTLTYQIPERFLIMAVKKSVTERREKRETEFGMSVNCILFSLIN